MHIYIFGNQDLESDNLAFKVANKFKDEFNEIEFITVKPNEDLPFKDKEDVILMDVVFGIDKVEFITSEHIDKITLPPRSTAHDFDLAFQLKYLKKLGKLGSVSIIGLPGKGEIDYFLIHSIFKKLVAQDIQGS